MSENTTYSNIITQQKFSNRKVETLRERLGAALSESEYADRLTVVVTGSYGRREASQHSDLDYYMFFDADMPPREEIPEQLEAIEKIVSDEVPALTGDTNTFGSDAVIHFSNMLEPIGGQEDTNQSMTRRMLFLLEGDWLYNGPKFSGYRKRLLRRYIREDARPEAVPLFLLNDIIRYYRTITTDLEQKVAEQQKPWGLRDIKLRFSRKLLYFGGIIVAAELVDKTHQERLDEADRLFSMPVISRIKALSDTRHTNEILRIYDLFLAEIAQESVRDALKTVKREDRRDSQEYNRLRDLSFDFARALSDWLSERYHKEHPIHLQLDMSTLEKVSGAFVADDLRTRTSDVIWRVRWSEEWLYIYLLLEFQSTVDRHMAVRMLSYVGLLYQDLVSSGDHAHRAVQWRFTLERFHGHRRADQQIPGRDGSLPAQHALLAA